MTIDQMKAIGLVTVPHLNGFRVVGFPGWIPCEICWGDTEEGAWLDAGILFDVFAPNGATGIRR